MLNKTSLRPLVVSIMKRQPKGGYTLLFVWGAGGRNNKLTSSEYDETTWSARTWMTFVAQRISVAVQLSSAQEVAEALGLSVAADPRAQ